MWIAEVHTWAPLPKEKKKFISFSLSSDSYAWLEHTKIAISWFSFVWSHFFFFQPKIGYSIPMEKAIAQTFRRAFDALWLCVWENGVALFITLFISIYLFLLPQRLVISHFYPSNDGFYFIEIKLRGLCQNSEKNGNISGSNNTTGEISNPNVHRKRVRERENAKAREHPNHIVIHAIEFMSI